MTRFLKQCFFPVLVFCAALCSCKKYLDAKPDKSLVTPTTVESLQGLLDYNPYMNQLSTLSGEVASDNYYLTDALFAALPDDRMRNAYLWQQHVFNGTHPDDWQNEYTVVYNANIVLDNLPAIARTAVNAAAWDNCRGQALVFRAKSFLEIAQVWAKAYDSATAATDLGIPLRLTPDFNAPTTRASIKASYEQVIADLKEAIPLLPDNPAFVFRPSKPAAYGMLARTYLYIGNYRDAAAYADSCLVLNNTLLDYNTLNPVIKYPFSAIRYTNPEDIMHSTATSVNYVLAPTRGRVDTTLYNSYAANDLRKAVFFKANSDGSHYFAGNYDAGSSSVSYNGLAVDELYLVRAECAARLGDASGAVGFLNKLLAKRWKAGTFVPLVATSATDALNLVLSERRKELVYRSLRFGDLKRLNRDGAGIVLQRTVQGQVYTLPPNDPRYALPIPDDVVQETGIQQN